MDFARRSAHISQNNTNFYKISQLKIFVLLILFIYVHRLNQGDHIIFKNIGMRGQDLIGWSLTLKLRLKTSQKLPEKDQ